MVRKRRAGLGPIKKLGKKKTWKKVNTKVECSKTEELIREKT